jgi:hypothetical protein
MAAKTKSRKGSQSESGSSWAAIPVEFEGRIYLTLLQDNGDEASKAFIASYRLKVNELESSNLRQEGSICQQKS